MAIDDIKNLMNRVDETSNRNLYVLERYTNLTMTAPAKRLDESGINRLLQHLKDGGVIISANKSLTDEGDIPEILMGEYAKWCTETSKQDKAEFVKEFSRKQSKNLLKDIKDSEYSYSPVYGGYKGTDDVTDLYEPSFVIYCHNKRGDKLDFEKLKNYGLELCKKYYQDSVYIREPAGKSYYYNSKGEIVGEEGDGGTKINRTNQPYFTALKKGHVQRFTDDIRFLEEGHYSGKDEWYVNPGHYSYNSRVLRLSSGEVIL